MSSNFSKKMEEAIVEAMALGNAGSFHRNNAPDEIAINTATGSPLCADGWLGCMEDHAAVKKAFANDTIQEHLRISPEINSGNPEDAEPRSPFAVIADWLRGNTEPKFDIDELVTRQRARAFLINPRTGESCELPMQSFELGGWEPSDDTTLEEDCDTEELRTLSMESHPSYARKSVSWGGVVDKPQHAIDDLVIIPREELTRLRQIEDAYEHIRNIVRE